FGLFGRSPDHVASYLTSFAACPEVVARGGERFAENVIRYYEHARENDLYVSYLLIPPQIDRSKPMHQQDDPTAYAGVVEEREDGVVVAGAAVLGTGSAISDEVLLSFIVPLAPGDESHAISCAIPIGAPGVRLILRRPYAQTASSVFDYPLSSRFDETDAFVIFDR